jgi:hypothetical protein
MNIKELKLIIADLNDNVEVTKELLHSFTKPNWAKGKELWIQYKSGANESLADGWKRITGEECSFTLHQINRWKDGAINYCRYSNGYVLLISPISWSIQEDPTFTKASLNED